MPFQGCTNAHACSEIRFEGILCFLPRFSKYYDGPQITEARSKANLGSMVLERRNLVAHIRAVGCFSSTIKDAFTKKRKKGCWLATE
jgi:hypothetical protein